MEDIEFKISQFIDNEMPLEEQGVFFKELSLNAEARFVLNDFLVMKKEISGHYSGMNPDLPAIKISSYSQGKGANLYKRMFYFSAAALILVLIGSAFLFSDLINTRNNLNALKADYTKTGLDLQNSKKDNLPVKTVLAQVSKSSKPRVFHAAVDTKNQAAAEKTGIQNTMPVVRNQMSKYEKDFVAIKITKDDFLIPQMIGN